MSAINTPMNTANQLISPCCGNDFAMCENNYTFFSFYMQLKELSLNEFKWTGLPDTCNERWLELILYDYGYALFFQNDLNKAFFTLQCTIGGAYNLYNVPIWRRAYASNGFNQDCDDQNSVIIFNNRLWQPTSLFDLEFAKRLTNIQRAIDTNINAQRTPVLITGSQSQQRALNKVYEKWESNEPVIFGDSEMNRQPITAIKTDAPIAFPELIRARTSEWNRALSFHGIDNANTDKREREITAEVEANTDYLMMSRETRLNTRREAADMINKMWGFDIKVEYNERRENIGTIHNRVGSSNGGYDRAERESDVPTNSNSDSTS